MEHGFTTLWIYTILKPNGTEFCCAFVSLPYEFTLFSNTLFKFINSTIVSLPYEFTLFSNMFLWHITRWIVSLPYEFTLFSNVLLQHLLDGEVSLPYEFTLFSNCEVTLMLTDGFHYLMNLHYSQTAALDNYNKRRVSLPYEFTLFSNSSVSTSSPP